MSSTPASKPLIGGRWYWVRRAGSDEWFPAYWEYAVGWTNGDTWEDLLDEIYEWKLIPLPEELPDG